MPYTTAVCGWYNCDLQREGRDIDMFQWLAEGTGEQGPQDSHQ